MPAEEALSGDSAPLRVPVLPKARHRGRGFQVSESKRRRRPIAEREAIRWLAAAHRLQSAAFPRRARLALSTWALSSACCSNRFLQAVRVATPFSDYRSSLCKPSWPRTAPRPLSPFPEPGEGLLIASGLLGRRWRRDPKPQVSRWSRCCGCCNSSTQRREAAAGWWSLVPCSRLYHHRVPPRRPLAASLPPGHLLIFSVCELRGVSRLRIQPFSSFTRHPPDPAWLALTHACRQTPIQTGPQCSIVASSTPALPCMGLIYLRVS